MPTSIAVQIPIAILPIATLAVPEVIKPETVEIFNDETEEMEAVEVNDVSGFKKLTNKWRL